jgi:hypothetical protein
MFFELALHPIDLAHSRILSCLPDFLRVFPHLAFSDSLLHALNYLAAYEFGGTFVE